MIKLDNILTIISSSFHFSFNSLIFYFFFFFSITFVIWKKITKVRFVSVMWLIQQNINVLKIISALSYIMLDAYLSVKSLLTKYWLILHTHFSLSSTLFKKRNFLMLNLKVYLLFLNHINFDQVMQTNIYLDLHSLELVQLTLV